MKEKTIIHPRVTYYAQQSIDKIKKDFHLTSNGYSIEMVEKSRNTYGRNFIQNYSSDTVWYRFRRAFFNPFMVILFLLALISFITDLLLPSSYTHNMLTFALILCMLLIGGSIRFSQEMKAKKVTDHVMSLLTSHVKVLRMGKWENVLSSDVVVGDIIRITSGERVPADVRMLHTKHLFVSQSAITGESILFMGSSILSGTGTGVVLAVGKDCAYGEIELKKGKRRNQFDQGANAIAWVLIRFMLVLIPLVFVSSVFTKGNWASAFLFALSVAIGLVPEMMPMVMNACLAKGSINMSKQQTVVKNINAMQVFGSMDVLCVDKTGTLTGENISLEYFLDVFGNESKQVLELAYLNSLFQEDSHDPLDQAILAYDKNPEYCTELFALSNQCQKIEDFPFRYDYKFSGAFIKKQTKKIMIIKGDVDQVLKKCMYVEYKGERKLIDQCGKESMHAIVDDMLEDGMKVLALAYRVLDLDEIDEHIEENLTLLGYLVFFDAPKRSAEKAILNLKALNVEIRVLSGDQKKVVSSICSRLHVDSEKIMTGKQLDQLSDDKKIMEIEKTKIFAELSPKQKMEIVSILQTNGHTVGFLGDGMNDLPAIVEADVGISVHTAVEPVKDSADVLLLKKDLKVLGNGVLEGRKAFVNMFKYIKITASSNFGNILSIVVASVCLPFLPISAIQLLLLNIFYDIICLVLPWDHVDEEIYEKPLEWSGRSLGKFMRFFGPISSVFDMITFGFLFFVLCPSICGNDFFSLSDPLMQRRFIAIFQTGWFIESMWTQILILYLLRTQKFSIFESKPSSTVFMITVVGIIGFTAFIFTPIASLIGLTALPFAYFCFLFVIVCLYLFTITIWKKRYIKKYHDYL